MRYATLIAFCFLGCAVAPTDQKLGAVESRIIGGRPSGDDENANVYTETRIDDQDTLRCSGRLIAPGLVLSARHCFLERRVVNLLCKPDGTPVDIADTVNYPIMPASSITVFIGSNKQTQKKVAVKKLLARSDLSICRGDLAYLVLAEPGLDERTPIRRAPPGFGQKIRVSGWGFVNDGNHTPADLPNTRTTIDATILDYGPPALPPGVFSVSGGTLCLGDSGAGALVEDGKVIGTYSRIDDGAKCTSEFVKNYMTAVVSEPTLLAEAYAAIGEEPWFAGEQKPWLAKANTACVSDDQCASDVCDAGVCKPGCGATGIACPIGQSCGTDGICAAEVVADAGPDGAQATPPPAAPPTDDSCVIGPSRGNGNDGVAMSIAAAAVVVVFHARRRRAARTT